MTSNHPDSKQRQDTLSCHHFSRRIHHTSPLAYYLAFVIPQAILLSNTKQVTKRARQPRFIRYRMYQLPIVYLPTSFLLVSLFFLQLTSLLLVLLPPFPYRYTSLSYLSQPAMITQGHNPEPQISRRATSLSVEEETD